MDLHEIPLGQRLTIAIFGLRNSGKSSLLNALTNQDLALVSDVKGTTTDPVHKAMELFPLGPVNIIDTPGYDDEGSLGKARVEKTRQVLNRGDFALLVLDGTSKELSVYEQELLRHFKARKLPYFVVVNKIDLGINIKLPADISNCYYVSCKTKEGIEGLQVALGKLDNKQQSKVIVRDLLPPEATVVLVTPIDESAPKGRLILPQQQVLRELLEASCITVVSQAYNLEVALRKLAKPPALVITDSQAFKVVSEVVPENIPLTSFSILMARYKGELAIQLEGIKAVATLQAGDKVLIAEGCSHHRQCDDIGTVKIPNWLNAKVKGALHYDFYAGGDFPKNCKDYKLVIHCGGCMLTPQQIKSRINMARGCDLPVTNYGMLIAYLNGILDRALAPLQLTK